MSSNTHNDITIIYLITGKQYRYKGSVRIQKNGTDTGNQYDYKKTYNF